MTNEVQRKYTKYVSFAWPTLEVAVSIFNVSPSVKTIFCWQGIRGYISVMAALTFVFFNNRGNSLIADTFISYDR